MAERDGTWLPLGLTCIAIGLAAIAIATGYPYGTITAMGPGFLPTAVAILLIVFGVLVLYQRGGEVPAGEPGLASAPAFSSEGPWRAMLAIGAAIVLFGFTIAPLGLPIAVFLVVVVAGHALPVARLVPLLLLAAFLALASAIVFVTLLGLNLRLLPQVS